MALPKQNQAEPQVEAETEQPVETPTTDALEPATPQPEPSVNVPATPTPHAPPAVVEAGTVQVMDSLAQSGFAGLEIDWTSFPTVVLNQGEFETSDGNPLGVEQFSVRLMQSRKRYVLRTTVIDDDDAELAYTYDLGELDNPESDLAIKVTKWREEDDLDYKVKEYIEVVALVEDDNCTLNQQMVLLQIPPTSSGRFSGYTASNQMVHRQLPSEYLTLCTRGEKVTKAPKPFYPWAFKYVG